jgi:low affinity Fe/Cu permease
VQNSQNRDARAMQLKLDEFISSIWSALNRLVDKERNRELVHRGSPALTVWQHESTSGSATPVRRTLESADGSLLQPARGPV